MKNKAEAKKEEAAKDQTAKAKPAKGKRNGTAKTAKESKGEPADRLPGNLDELKASKGGLVAFLFLSGKGKDEIAQKMKTAFKLPDAQAVKIVRRITGRARFFQRAVELTTAK